MGCILLSLDSSGSLPPSCSLNKVPSSHSSMIRDLERHPSDACWHLASRAGHKDQHVALQSGNCLDCLEFPGGAWHCCNPLVRSRIPAERGAGRDAETRGCEKVVAWAGGCFLSLLGSKK